MNDAARKLPPPSVSILWCPVCGRTDRYQTFTGKSHFNSGGKCAGTPVSITYGWPVDSYELSRGTHSDREAVVSEVDLLP